MNLMPVDFGTIKTAIIVKEKYGYSYWDSLILASSLQGGCSVIYSEDMRHGHLIEETLTIINPFVIFP